MKNRFIYILKIWFLLILSSVLVNGCKPKKTGDEFIQGFFTSEILFRMSETTPSNQVSTLAGSGTAGSTDGLGAMASFYYPFGVAVGPDGTIYVADSGNNKIRKISP